MGGGRAGAAKHRPGAVRNPDDLLCPSEPRGERPGGWAFGPVLLAVPERLVPEPSAAKAAGVSRRVLARARVRAFMADLPVAVLCALGKPALQEAVPPLPFRRPAGRSTDAPGLASSEASGR